MTLDKTGWTPARRAAQGRRLRAQNADPDFRARKTQGRRNRHIVVKVAPHAHPLVRDFMAELNRQRATFVDVATRTNVSMNTMRCWQNRHMPRIDLFDAALNALGLKLAIVARREGAES